MAYNLYDLFNTKPSKRRKLLKAPPVVSPSLQTGPPAYPGAPVDKPPSSSFLETPAYATAGWSPEGREQLQTSRQDAADRRIRAYGTLRAKRGIDTPETTSRIMSERFKTPYAEEFERYAPPEQFSEYEELQRAGRRSEADVLTTERGLERAQTLESQTDEDRLTRIAAEKAEQERIAAAEGRTAEEFKTGQEFAVQKQPLELEALRQETEGAPIRASERYARLVEEMGRVQEVMTGPATDPAMAEWASGELARLQGEINSLETGGAPPMGNPAEAGAAYTPPPVPTGLSSERFERDVGYMQNILTATGLSPFISGENPRLDDMASDRGSPDPESMTSMNTFMDAVRQALSMARDKDERNMIRTQITGADGYDKLMRYTDAEFLRSKYFLGGGLIVASDPTDLDYQKGGAGRISQMSKLVAELEELMTLE